MRIGSRFWVGVAVFAMIMTEQVQLFAQEKDSVSHTPFDRYWTKPRIVPKVGIGAQDRAFVELGVQFHSIYKHPLTLMSNGPYCTVDVFIDDSNILLGPKLGYEFTAGLFGAAADLTYYIDHNYDGEGGNRSGVVVTPKVGVSILGFANLFYGYAIPMTDETIGTISRNRFSLVFNLNRYYFDLKEAPRRH